MFAIQTRDNIFVGMVDFSAAVIKLGVGIPQSTKMLNNFKITFM